MFKLLIFLTFAVYSVIGDCKPSATTASGSNAPKQVCSGQLIFEDNFDKLDSGKWQHEQTLGGGGNWEFQWYSDDPKNSYAQNGNLHIRPTLVADDFGGEKFLYSGTIEIPQDNSNSVDESGGGHIASRSNETKNESNTLLLVSENSSSVPYSREMWCTNSDNFGCKRTGNAKNILNPIKSARLRTLKSFAFKYGKVEVNAKLPAGDWLWPAIWLLPENYKYGSWPASGEIDMMEGRGNRKLYNGNTNIGTQQVASTLHWGPNPQNNRFQQTHYEKNLAEGYNTGFHKYQLEWTPDYLKFSVDNEEIGRVTPPGGGFWQLGNLQSSGLPNPWTNSKMAPFDQEFHLILNLATGGTNGYFADGGNKPWSNSADNAMTTFWQGRQQWLPDWRMNTEDSHLQVDYVRVWAL